MYTFSFSFKYEGIPYRMTLRVKAENLVDAEMIVASDFKTLLPHIDSTTVTPILIGSPRNP